MDHKIKDALKTFQDIASRRVAELCIPSVEDLLKSSEGDMSKSHDNPVKIDIAAIPSMIDHTNLKPTATKRDIAKLVDEAANYHFASVCINSAWIPYARKLSDESGSDVKLCTVIGFPLGADLPQMKYEQTKIAVDNGAEEVDMVINIAALKDKDFDLFIDDVKAVLDASGKAVTKGIIEACYLSDEEKVWACVMLKSAGYDFVKTSTGFGEYGARTEDVSLMRAVVGKNVGVKAAGGIRSLRDAVSMVSAGASRIGASAGVSIANEISKK